MRDLSSLICRAHAHVLLDVAMFRLITLYQHLSDVLHPRPAQSGTPARKPVQVQYLRTEQEAVLGWVRDFG